MAWNLVCFFVLAIISTIYGQEKEALVGASDARSGEFPYTVSIRQGNTHICGGAIIGPQHILTAAHCVYVFRQSKAPVKVVTGTNNLRYDGDTYTVTRMFVHSGYKDEYSPHYWENDIAVLKLATPIRFNSLQTPIRLASSNPPSNITATVSGWGRRSLNTRISTVLQKLSLKVIPINTCKWYFNLHVTEDMVCTLNGKNIGTCGGDSGSPLVYNDELIGVVSGGEPCATGKPDIFTNVYKFRRFIENIMAL